MNVLVYSGPEVLQVSLNHTLSTLRSILLPHYTVQPISQQSLTTQPWKGSCALLVVPQSRETPFVSVANKKIKEFVEAGGAYLMLGTGASVTQRSGGLGSGSRGLNLGLTGEDAPALPLKFYDKFNNCYITCCEDSKEDGLKPRIASLRSADGASVKGVYDTGAGHFTGFDEIKGLYVLARYELDGGEGPIAGLSMEVSGGSIAIWCPSIEYSLTEEPASSISSNLSAQEIESADKSRKKLLKDTLLQLGLQLPPEDEKKPVISRPLPQFLTSTPSKLTIVSRITDAIATPQSGSQLSIFKDADDEFHFHSLQESADLLNSAREAAKTSSDPATWQPKHVIVCRDGLLPDRELTPLFDLELFYKALAAAREKEGLSVSSEPWGMGEALIYGEAVTSTQSMFDKNPILLGQLPTPLLSLASHQLAGRGRGSNIWLSPSGCLQFSLLLRIPLAGFPPSKIVFLQYLFSLAVVEACRDEAVLGAKAGERIRLKWPNDLYASVGLGGEAEDLRKIGGVLVNTSFSGGKVDLVIGCGLNVLNLPPIASLSQLQAGTKTTLSMEKTAAAIMAKFETMWNVFLRERSFEPFMDLYLKRWLHSDQVVTLTTTTPPTQVRITGITADHGLLRTIPERSGIGRGVAGEEGEYIDLQPDGNSFDLMANLIKSRS